MYTIIPDPNIGKKVKTLKSRGHYPAGTIGTIDSVLHRNQIIVIKVKSCEYMFCNVNELEEIK